MPFIDKQDRTERQELKVKIRPEVIGMVEDYATFLDSETWYVVQEILRKCIDGDREFRKWKEQQAATPMEPHRKAKVA